jgi:hypothetical protein
METKLRNLTTSLLLAGCSLFFCLLLLEVGLRVYNPFHFRVKAGRIVLTAHRVELYRGSSPKFEKLITVTRNSLGFRGPDPPKDLRGVLSMIAVGGSTTECRFVSDQAMWTTVLSRQLSERFRAVWVDNAGLNGHSTFANAVLLRDQIVPLHPKIVIFHIGGMDQGRSAPMDMDLDNMAGIHSWRPWDLLLFAGRSSELFNTGYNLYRYSLARTAHMTDEEAIDTASLGSLELPRAEIEAETSMHERTFIPAYKKRVQGLIDASRAAGIIPVLMTQPMQWGEGIDDITGRDLATLRDPWNPYKNSKLEWSVLDVYNEATRQVGATSGTLVIDLAHSMPKSSRYFLDDVHYTAAGAAEVGTIASRTLIPFLAAHFPEFDSTHTPHPAITHSGEGVVTKGGHS